MKLVGRDGEAEGPFLPTVGYIFINIYIYIYIYIHDYI